MFDFKSYIFGCAIGVVSSLFIHHNTEHKQCMTQQEIETAVYEIKDEIIERELHLIIVGDEYHPALKVPEIKPEVMQ